MLQMSSPDEGPDTGPSAEQERAVDREWLDQVATESLAAELAAQFDGPPWLDVDAPEFVDDERFPDEELLAMRGPVSEWDLIGLASIDPAGLSVASRLEYLRRVECLESLVAARKARALVAVAGTDASDSTADRHAAMEVALLRRVGEGAAASGIATARALHVAFPQFLRALESGEVSEWHCRVLVSGTVHVNDRDTIAALQDRLLPQARRKTPTEFRREVAQAVADLDAEREAERVGRARASRYVTCRRLPDGLGYLGIVTDWPTVSAMKARIDGDGRALQRQRGGATAVRDGDDDALADACRADALVARFLGAEQPDGAIVFDPSEIPVSLTLVMDLDTVRGEADRHALLDGEPIPAAMGRELADAATTWRRAVTDPVTGHLLDYGRAQYLPDRLRDYVLARDHCRVPGCTARGVTQLQMDHALPFPDGRTSAANCGGLCVKHHQRKTAGQAAIQGSNADGSATWITAWGQRITIPPRPFLHDPVDTRARATSPPGTVPHPTPPPSMPDQPDDPPF